MTEDVETIKIQYCVGETGWAEKQNDGLFKIVNSPAIAKNLRWGDIVRVKEDDGILRVTEVVRRQLPHRAEIFYKSRENWPEIVGALRARYKYTENISVEGSYPPQGDTEGHAVVNFNDEVDLKHALGQIEGVRIVEEEVNE